MAKKIKITENLDKEFVVEKKKKKISILKIVSLTLNVILIAGIIIGIIYFNNKIIYFNNKLEEKDDEINSRITSSACDFSCSYKYSTEIEKANMLDDYIVFVLDGYGNVYYTYDCVKKLTAGQQYSFSAYNIDNAKGMGYKQGKC